MSKKFPQSEEVSEASSSFPSTLTLRIYHDTTSFTASFKERFTERGVHESRCSCYRICQVWLGADDTDCSLRAAIFPETPCRTTIMTFILRSPTNKQKARDLCASSQNSLDAVPFRRRMQELMSVMATLCEAKHPIDQPKSKPATDSTLRPMRTNGLDKDTIGKELRAKMAIPLAPSEEGWGYIYILRSQWDISTMSVLKIGFSKYHPEHRAHELASCLSAPEVVAHTPLIPHAKRIEAIIHTELVAKRKVQVCGQCGQKHGEWFTISHAESREVVTRWSRWVFRQPYLDGKLSDEWHNFLQAQNFESIKSEVTLPELWVDVLDGFPHHGTHSTPEEHLATYVNACYSENLGERLLGPLSESPMKRDFRSLQKKLREARSGQALEITDYYRAMDEFISAESKVGTNLGITVQDQNESDPSASQYDIDALRKKAMEFEAWKKKVSEFETWKKQLLEEAEALKNLKTGAVSVSDPKQGVTESPLGDATLLPVVSLKALTKIDAPARNWIGYNPTHQGFQLLQEAYQRGEWVGNAPQFQLPKAFRKARAKSSNEDSTKTQTSAGKTIRFVRTEESDTWELGAELNDSFIEQLKQATELAKNPLGRALMEKELLRSFRHLGLNFTGDYSADALSISSDSSGDEMSFNKMDID